VEFVYSIRKDLLFNFFEAGAGNYCFELAVEFVSQRTTFCQKFQADVCDDAFFYFAIYK